MNSIGAPGAGFIGVSDHGGWAVLVTVARDGTLLDRRRVELVDACLPGLPHHHEGQMLPIGKPSLSSSRFAFPRGSTRRSRWTR